jgi:hypothetical protein
MEQDNYEAALQRKREMTARFEAERAEREAEMDAEMAALQAAEIRAERMNDWIMGGGDPADAGRFAMYEEHGWPKLIDPEDGVCEHGMSASLCVGPSHYPLDM